MDEGDLDCVSEGFELGEIDFDGLSDGEVLG